MTNYKQEFLDLNYSYFTSMTGSVLLRDDGVIAVNPENPEHHMSNNCFRIRLSNVKDLEQLVFETKGIFVNASCTPRYHVDELSKPSLDSLYNEFKKLGYENFVKEENSVMTWSRQNIEKPLPTQYPCCRSATIDDMEHIADIIAIAFGYNTANYDWLRYTIKKKMSMPKSYKIFVATVPGDQGDAIGSIVILFSPPGLPHLGYVGSVATDPDHQRKGLAALCLQFALESTAKPSQTFYLETFEETHHAFRMYEKIGFRFEGRIKTFMVALEENK